MRFIKQMLTALFLGNCTLSDCSFIWGMVENYQTLSKIQPWPTFHLASVNSWPRLNFTPEMIIFHHSPHKQSILVLTECALCIQSCDDLPDAVINNKQICFVSFGESAIKCLLIISKWILNLKSYVYFSSSSWLEFWKSNTYFHLHFLTSCSSCKPFCKECASSNCLVNSCTFKEI